MAKKKETQAVFDIGARLENIQMLKDTNRIKEAIAYEYMLFVMLCTMKYKAPKQPSQSIRDYAIAMVKDYNLDPGNIYPFVQEVEQVIYGGRHPSPDAFQHSLTTFGKVFEEIVGKALPPL
jgi:hypothetical protein